MIAMAGASFCFFLGKSNKRGFKINESSHNGSN